MSAKRPHQHKPKKTRDGQTGLPSKREGESSGLGSGLENEGFVVDLFLDQSKEVHLTQILHVKSNDGEAWEGWDEKQLISFFVERAELKLPQPAVPVEEMVLRVATDELASVVADEAPEPTKVGELEPPGPEAVEPVMEEIADAIAATESPIRSERATDSALPPSSEPLVVEPEIEKDRVAAEPLIVRGIEIISAGTTSRGRMLCRGEAFDVRLLVELANLIPGSETELGYSIWISAFQRGQSAKYFIATRQGVVKASDEAISVNIPRQNLEPGTYFFQADVTFSSPAFPEGDLPPILVKSLSLKSGLLQVI